MEQPLRRREGREHRGLAAAAGLAEDGDVARVAAERADVVAHPFECVHEVAQPEIRRVRELLARARQTRQPEIREGIQPMRDGDHDDVVLPRELGAVVEDRVARARALPAAVKPHHHGPRAAPHLGRPDVEPQAVLAHRSAARERVADLGNHRA